MGIAGSGVRDGNFRLRFFIIVFMSIVAFGSVLYWKSQLLVASEYQELPEAGKLQEIKQKNRVKRHSLQEQINKRYQLDN